MTNLAGEIARLRQAPLDELVDEYERLYERRPRNKNRTWLWRKVAWQLQANTYGGLSETTEEHLRALWDKDPPLIGRKAQRPAAASRGQHRNRDGLSVGTELLRQATHHHDRPPAPLLWCISC